jgi:hypothetical protein
VEFFEGLGPDFGGSVRVADAVMFGGRYGVPAAEFFF